MMMFGKRIIQFQGMGQITNGWRGFAAWILPLAMLALLTACSSAVNPASGKKEWLSISPEQERQIGREQHPKLLAQFGGAYSDDDKARDIGFYVSRLGAKLAQHSELPPNHFTFTVVDSPIVNAFALPGGYVYVSRGLIAIANDEAELAGVIAHEIGHVTARHTARRMTNAQRGQVISIGASILGGLAGVRGVGQVANQAAALTLQSWSREQELEADRLAIRYLRRAGYDPRAMVSFLESMQAEQDIQSQLAQRPGEADSWNLMSTHPRTGPRIQRAIDAVSNSGATLPTRRNREGFLAEIDGITYGDSAKQGFVRGTSFLHPEMGFTFDLPSGWVMENTPNAVMGRSPDRQVFKFQAGAAKGMDAPSVLRGYMKRNDLPNLDSLRTDMGRFATSTLSVRLGQDDGVAMFAAVVDRNDQAWIMRFVKRGRLDRRTRNEWEDVLYSLRRLYADEAADLKPWRLELVTIRDRRHLARLLRRSPLEERTAERLRILNGVDQLGPGQEIKIVVE